MLLSPELRRAGTEWLPGIAAGLAPMFLYVLAISVSSHHVDLPPGHPTLVNNGFQTHLLIFTVANSAVSVTSSFPRIGRLPVKFRGRAPNILNYCNFGIGLAAALLYGFVENGSSGLTLTCLTAVGALFSMVFSFYTEMAFARIHTLRKPKPRNRVTNPSGIGPKSA